MSVSGKVVMENAIMVSAAVVDQWISASVSWK
jgi:hypothetical protein